jgi:hypothetical protein
VTGRELLDENSFEFPSTIPGHNSALRFSFVPGLKNKKYHRKSSYHGEPENERKGAVMGSWGRKRVGE